MQSSMTFALLVVCTVICGPCHCQRRQQRRREMEEAALDLLSFTYTREVRPYPDGDDSPVRVSLSYDLLYATHTDQDHLDTVGYLGMNWQDERLIFSYHMNLSSIVAPADRLWLPDIELYNADAPGLKMLNAHPQKALVLRNGSVTWISQVSTRSLWSIEHNSSADDTVTCTMRFGSWIYSTNDLDLQPGYVSRGHMVPGVGWTVTDASLERVNVTYPCCPDTTYGVLDLTLTMQRRQP